MIFFSRKRKIDETNYTSELKKSIDNYVKILSKEHTKSAFTPHSTGQKLKNFFKPSYCFDLLKELPNDKLLILEVKTTDNLKKFNSYRLSQHNFNTKLRQSGIPIDYCYNLKFDYGNRNDDEYCLTYTNTAEPLKVCDTKGNLINTHEHISLKRHLERLVNGEPPIDDMYQSEIVGYLFSMDILENISDLDTRFLLLAYNPKLKKLLVLNREDIKQLVKTVSKEISIGTSKMDFLKENVLGIKTYFTELGNYVVASIEKYELRQKEIEQKIKQAKEQRANTKEWYSNNKKRDRDKGQSRGRGGRGM